ncbi:AAA family ATPase [Helicobacter sp. MIT 11-5569]|uniref:VirB4 family type IV secretion/conjugal transfer ATPase n=1 Tax=Helicobacter sp. MIT 11-5569 TaxID=1548151 RepID=UPI00068D4D21|nr:ATP-binding protein [Helicobacter sp. MIT 11-5569]TLD85193.1 AAA family ATPase [Helicobacter sp. MIT 11-5569]
MLKSFLKNNRSQTKQKNTNKDIKKLDMFKMINNILKQGDSLFTLGQPNIYSLAQENNIAQKYDENLICTSDKNLCIGFKLFGYSYSSVTPEEELMLSESRNRFFTSLDNDVEMNIICKKEKILLENTKQEIKNPYAKEIVDKWENLREAYQIVYYIIISTKTKAILGELNKFKDKLTKEELEAEQDQKEQEEQEEKQNFNENDTNIIELSKFQKQSQAINYGFRQKAERLNNIKESLRSTMGAFKPKQLNADELINFFATYANLQPTNLKYSSELLTDCYITSNVEFKKDYIVFYTNTGKTIYARFISVKAYETENISSLINTAILRQNLEYTIFIHAETYPKDKALKKIRDIAVFAVQEAKAMLESLKQDIQSDREKLLEVSYSILIYDENREILEEKTNQLKGVLENQSLATTRETINLIPLYFSFFPSRGNLNARLRSLQSSNLAVMMNLENDILGFKDNRWGNAPISIFRHLSGSPYFFNFHATNGKEASGHTMIIGGTGTGKTALTQFLMCNLFKYNINIFALDKLRGMHNFARYVEGEYHDLEDSSGFKLNPFSLEKTIENKGFLKAFLAMMCGVTKHDTQEINNINNTLDRILELPHAKLNDFYDSIEIMQDSKDIKMALKEYIGEDSIFDNNEDALNFEKQLAILNMDAILKNKELSALTAIYLFHKIKNVSKNSNKGFFVFVDELKDYLNDEIMREHILEAILEVRKINGVIMMATQDIGFFREIPKGQSFLSNMTNFLIYPTNNQKSLEDMRDLINLTGSEVAFLRQTQPIERKILLKRGDYSAILDVNLSRLGEHLRVFSSDAGDVKNLKELKRTYGEREWRNLYLKNHQIPQY